MAISRWGKRVEEKMAGPAPTTDALGQELSPSELVSAMAQNAEIRDTEVLLAEGLATRVTRFYRGVTLRVVYHMANDWYVVTVRAVHQGKPESVTWQMRSEDIYDSGETTAKFNAFLDKVAQHLIRMLKELGIIPQRTPDVERLAQASVRAGQSFATLGAQLNGLTMRGVSTPRMIMDEVRDWGQGPSQAEEREAIESIRRSAQKKAE